MKISSNVPKAWDKIIKKAAIDADCQSVAQFVQLLLDQSEFARLARQENPNLPPLLGLSWGGVKKHDKNASEQDTGDVTDAR
jgi:hypothetical protein